MNNQRRKEIEKNLEAMRDILATLESLKDEEQEYIDNMPENLQESEKYYQSEGYVDIMEDAIGEIDSAIEEIQEVTQ